MTHLEVLYKPEALETPALTLDSAALLERLRAIAGDDLTSGWHTAAAVRRDDSSWLVTLEHDTEDSATALRERLVTPADPLLRLYLDTEPVRTNAGPAIEQLSLPLPVEVPSVLTRPEEHQRKRASVQGVLAGLFVSAALGLLTPQGSTVRHMFEPNSPTAAVPISILCLFFWGLTYGMNRRRRLDAIESLNDSDLLPAVLHGLRTQGVERLELALRGQTDEYTVVRYSPLLRRIWIALEQWLIRPNLQNAHLALEQQVISDREATQRAYNLLRIFVWATPVLGLIGTVVGISIAVGGFASFLSTNVDDISKIKAGLVGVTGGLSFAFLITLEGLLTSLVLMLFTSGIQTREERLYAGIERDVAERFLPELQKLAPEREPGVAAGADLWADALADTARRVIRAIEVAGKRIAAKWDEKHDVYVSDLHATREAVQLSAQTNAASLVSVLSDLDSSLQDLKPLLTNLSQPFVLQAVPASPRNNSEAGGD